LRETRELLLLELLLPTVELLGEEGPTDLLDLNSESCSVAESVTDSSLEVTDTAREASVTEGLFRDNRRLLVVAGDDDDVAATPVVAEFLARAGDDRRILVD
jgi:hypothetical protein